MKKYIAPILMVIALLAPLTGGAAVHAASNADNAMRTVDAVYMQINGSETDVTMNTVSVLEQACGTATKDSWMTAVTGNGNWYIAQWNPDELTYFWSYQGDAVPVYFNGTDFMWSSMVRGMARVNVAQGNPNCDYTTNPVMAYNPGSFSLSFVPDDGTRGVLLDTYPITYPEGYEGKIPKESVVVTAPDHTIPDVHMQSVTNYKATFYDRNFYSFDTPTWTCEDGFPPRLTLKLKRLNDGQETTTEVSSNSLMDYEIVKANVQQDYLLEARYSCTDNSKSFDTSQFYNFSVNENGNLVSSSDLPQCMQGDFPFVNPVSCITMMKSVGNMLAFGSVRFGNSWDFTNQCRTLGTLGDWLHLEDKSACPQVPSAVRNVVTPFVTFALGLMVTRFITMKTGRSM